MRIAEHFQVTGDALKRWLIAQTYDALAVGILWLVGLLALRVPLAPLWAVLGTIFQFVPWLGPLLALMGPAAAAGWSGGFEPMLYVVILYAVIVAVDGFVLQPYFMKRTARVPVLVSILTPLVLGSFLSVWGVFLSVPLLAIVYAYRERRRARLRS